MKMRLLTTFVTLILFSSVFCQENLCRTDILNGIQLENKNKVKDYIDNDFSTLWTHENNQNVYGIIGNNHQRISIKFLMIEKNIENPYEYFVYGKTKVKSNIREFVGKIIIDSIQEYKDDDFGIDDEYDKYENKGTKSQALLIGKYYLYEDKNQNHTGYFTGTLKSKFYIDKNGNVRYNDISIHSDGYFNNAFVGNWKKYDSSIKKKCNWGDYRVPNCNCDFDIGVSELNVSEKYIKNGWLDIVLKNQVPSCFDTKPNETK